MNSYWGCGQVFHTLYATQLQSYGIPSLQLVHGWGYIIMQDQ